MITPWLLIWHSVVRSIVWSPTPSVETNANCPIAAVWKGEPEFRGLPLPSSQYSSRAQHSPLLPSPFRYGGLPMIW